MRGIIFSFFIMISSPIFAGGEVEILIFLKEEGGAYFFNIRDDFSFEESQYFNKLRGCEEIVYTVRYSYFAYAISLLNGWEFQSPSENKRSLVLLSKTPPGSKVKFVMLGASPFEFNGGCQISSNAVIVEKSGDGISVSPMMDRVP